MSCMVVDPETIDNIVQYILNNTKTFAGIVTGEFTARDGEVPDKIGRLLYKMNSDAYYACYPGEKVARIAEGERIEDIYKWRPRPVPSEIQMYKHIQCFLYQCMESDEIEARPAFKELKALWISLGVKIIQNLPEYNKASWS